MRRISLIVLIAVIIVGGFFVYQRFLRSDFELPRGEAIPLEEFEGSSGASEKNIAGSQDAAVPIIKSTRQIFVTEGTKHSIPLNEILGGGPPKDGIPAIDNPKFVSASEGSSFVRDAEPGLGVVIQREARFYPYQILVWHEIANDTIQETPIVVTYCPLCATGVVYGRTIPSTGETPTFGVSGRLWQSNLLMYNRTKKGEEEKESLWSQVLGEAVVGEFTGDKLAILPSDTIRFGDWKKLHPETKVLSRDTGHFRSYGSDPYGDYYTDEETIFPTLGNDTRLFSKALVLGIEVGGKYKAYESGAIARAGIINDTFGGTPLLVVRDAATSADIQISGAVRIFKRVVEGSTLAFELRNNKLFDIKTGSEWSVDGVALAGSLKGKTMSPVQHVPGFWFSWVAVHPETELFK